MNKELDMTNVINESFTSYAGAVLQSRALVDVRDCIKPSARQIFYCMYDDNLVEHKPHRKTQTSVGSAMKVYIHGDSSLEGVIMRASQPFAMRYPLVGAKGNKGNLTEGSNWAASRYTEAWLSELCERLFQGVKKDTISEWRDNYDDTFKYPAVLPSKGFYNIVNGTFGVGIGAAASIPQFNLKEVNAALEKLIKNPDIDFDEIYCVPDFATGAYLLNANIVKELLRDGQGGSCKLRAKIEYDIKDNCLIVTEIPYGVYTNTICKELEAIIDSSENPGIDRFNDLTNTEALIKIYLTKKVQPTEVEKYLYRHTSLQSFYTINMTMLENGRYPKIFGWREALQAHINHELEVYKKEYEYDIKKMQHRVHIIDGLLICLAAIDEVIQVIKTSSSTKEAKERLLDQFVLDDEQATAVLAIKLASLARLEVEKLYNEKIELIEKINKILEILNNKDLLNAELIKGWREIAEKYGDERRTKIIEDFDEEDSFVPEDVFVVATTDNQVKTVPFNEFTAQSRNSKGTKKDNIVAYVPTRTDKNILIFTNNGKYSNIKVKDIKEGIFFNQENKIVAALDPAEAAPYLIFVTKNGMIKKSNSELYNSTRSAKTPIQALRLKEDDELVSVDFFTEEPIGITTKHGKFVEIETKSITPVGKNTMGVKGISLIKDEVIGGINIKKKQNNYLIFISANGYGKKVIDDFDIHNRGASGQKIGLEKGDYLIATLQAENNDKIIISGQPNSVCLFVADFPEISHTSIGNKLIKDSKIISAIKK